MPERARTAVVRSRIGLSLLTTLVNLSPAFAHHDVGHGASESLRTLSISGNDPSPRQRAGVVGSVVRTTDEPTLNTATVYGISGLLTLSFFDWLYLSGDFPVVLVDEDSVSAPKVGYGDTRLGAQGSWGSERKSLSTKFTAGASVILPTRTFTYEADPGRQWLVAPQFIYSGRGERWFWYGMLQTPFEFRPAGWALDLSPSLAVGLQVTKPWSLALAATADIRTLTVCATPTGSEVCSEGRATETNRPMGAVRGYLSVSSGLNLSERWSIFGSLQLPVTSRRDMEWAMSVGAQARF